MLSISQLFEQNERPRIESSASIRRGWAKQRIAEARAAAAAGKIDQKTLQQRVKYWLKVASGAVASPSELQSGTGASAAELKTVGTFF